MHASTPGADSVPTPLIDPATLADRLGITATDPPGDAEVSRIDPSRVDCFLVDCSFDLSDPALGHIQFLDARLPGSRYLHLDEDLSGPVIPGRTGRHPLPDRDLLRGRLAALGARADADWVATDRANGAFAARFWWLARWLGHERVWVLDGGVRAWQAAGLPLASGEPAPLAPASLPPRAPCVEAIDADAAASGGYRLVDARAAPRYRGEVEPIDPVAGHIPGAYNLPFDSLQQADGRFLPPDSIRARIDSLPRAAGDPPTACYCGSGVTAACLALGWAHAGLPVPALYPGSWSEWITDPARGVARGEAP